jgi:ABC-type polysaccharide/polyol phosphate export permease
MFATPTVYMQPRADAGWGFVQGLLAFNPMTGLIAAFQAACLGGPVPWCQLACGAATVAVVFLAGCLYFRRVEDSFADVI